MSVASGGRPLPHLLALAGGDADARPARTRLQARAQADGRPAQTAAVAARRARGTAPAGVRGRGLAAGRGCRLLAWLPGGASAPLQWPHVPAALSSCPAPPTLPPQACTWALAGSLTAATATCWWVPQRACCGLLQRAAARCQPLPAAPTCTRGGSHALGGRHLTCTCSAPASPPAPAQPPNTHHPPLTTHPPSRSRRTCSTSRAAACCWWWTRTRRPSSCGSRTRSAAPT
jgi:hypothetical protein